VDIVILAGGRCEPGLAELTKVSYRAEVPSNGRLMAEIVLDAVKPLGNPILVGGPVDLHTRHVEGGAHFIDSVARGLEVVTSDTFLLATVDLPCLTTEAAEDFVKRCDPEAALNYPIIQNEVCEKAFPGMKRTTLKLREGTFTGGNLGLMRTDLMRKALPILEKGYENRKKVFKLAQIIGFGTLGRVLFGQLVPATLPLATLERKVGKFLGVRVKAVVSPYAEIGADIDNAAQYNSLINLTNPQ